ncbi:carbon-nitrogen hydrolase family protein [Arthrobacter sp. KBS0703]|uniref:carbon-nitrogen hydrolase family protein n=1 Tax=Arthrobacter sp. KBS0703 TaxID=1955698 RepID=UPI00098F4BCC|nr:carbon-nitrogen hydrolase family protein [Arthrobacter sp. KBS0703]TSE16333.1 carbon-nitrogen hydrolase family protein [Arthrobacter sp. KBS0703]
MTSALTVSAVQYQALEGGIAVNAPEHVRLIEDADSHGARLVLFPELSLTGYNLPLLRDGDRPGGDQWLVPGDVRLDPVREICRRTGITAVVGAAYREADGTPRLAALALHPNGDADVGFKTHLHGDEESLFAAGPGPAVLDVDGWKIALAICFDAAHPGHSGTAADAGADVYAVSALYTEGEGHRLGLHLGARAMDNRTYTVLANLGGRTPLGPSCGLSGFWGPDGLPMQHASGTGTEVVTAVLRRGPLDRYRQERLRHDR